MCSLNLKHKSYTSSTNTYKRSKTVVYITSEYKDKYYINIKPDVSSSKPFEESLNSKEVKKIFVKTNNRTVPIGNVFEYQYKGGRVKIFKNQSYEEKHSLVNERGGFEKRDISIASIFIPLANRKVPSNISNISGILKTYGNKDEKP